MLGNLFAVEPALASSVRLPALGNIEQPIQKVEFAFLILMGLTGAALAHFVDLSLRIPGHAIVRLIPPIAFGMALVPRRGAGTSMGLVAAASTVMFNGARLGSAGLGAMTSLLLCGIVLEVVASRTRSGWPLYAGLALAGLAVNMAAFSVKFVAKLAGIGGGGGPLSTWLPRAAVTYPLCGLAAGLLCAVVLFRFRLGGEEQ